MLRVRVGKAYLWGLSGAALLLLLANAGTSSVGGPNKGEVSRDPKLLLPAFRAKLEQLFARLAARGFDPILHEGYRTPARAAMLAQKKAGIANSLHIYGAAADVISKSRLWAHPAFFQALGFEAEKLGLTWGGRFSEVDATHVQAVPGKQENTFRALAASARNAFAERNMRVG